VSAARIGVSPLAGRIGSGVGIGQGPAGIATPAAGAVAGMAAVGLPQIRYASTWPRGWMAAAVPQHVREFNAQISKAQMALAWLDAFTPVLERLAQSVQRQIKLPSSAGLLRAKQALQAVQGAWVLRYDSSLGSVDECLQWSPLHRARKYFTLAGWSSDSLQAQQPNDRELVAFSLMGQDQAHGAWLAQWGRSSVGSQYALAAALSPLLIQTHTKPSLEFSVDERLWPLLQERFVVKGNGQRFPAGQWVNAPLQSRAQAVQPLHWAVADDAALQAMQTQLMLVRERLAAVRAQIAQFAQDAGQTVHSGGTERLQQMQTFAQAFSDAGQAPAYDWVLAVVPAVRAISRRRVARLLKTTGALD
jgi:hypothetical protein